MSMRLRWGLRRLRMAVACAATACVALSGSAKAELVTAIGNGDRLITFDSATPGTITTNVAITGVTAGESLVGLDFRPAGDRLLYALGRNGSAATLYTINQLTGVASIRAALSAGIGAANAIGFDFNPVADLSGAASLRVITDLGLNYAVNATTGAVTVQTAISGPGGIAISGSAYTNNDNDPGTATTTLFGIDAGANTLLSTIAPGGGVYTTVGAGLGVDPSAASFDISGTGLALAAMQVGGVNNLYSVDLGTGMASSLGLIGAGGQFTSISGLTLQPAAVPEPSSMILLGICGAGAFGYRFRRKKTVV